MTDPFRERLFQKLDTYGVHDKDTFWAEAFSRDIGLLTRNEQWRLAGARVAIPGMGGVGGVHMITLVRAGVGGFHIADFDVYELANMNRQFGATVPALGRPKIDVMEEEAFNINPFLTIQKFPEGVTEGNVDEFLDGIDVVLDGIDFFAFKARRLIFNRALSRGIPVVTAGPLGFSTAFLVFTPRGMGFDRYFDVNDRLPLDECNRRFLLGVAPAATHRHYIDFTRVSFGRRRGPSLDLACQLCSAVATTEAIRIILGRPGLRPVPFYYQFDPYLHKLVSGRLRWGNRGPLQRLKGFILRWKFSKDQQEFKRLPPPQWPSQRVTSLPVPDEVMDSILIAGSYAPSIQNTQPWFVTQKENRLSVFLDRSRVIQESDCEELGAHFSIGCFLENTRIAASTFGLESKILEMPAKTKDDLVAEVELEPACLPRDYLFESIWERHTNRKNYSRRSLPLWVYTEFEKSLAPFSGARIHWLKTVEDIRRVLPLAFLADRLRVENPDIHRAVSRMYRWTMSEVM